MLLTENTNHPRIFCLALILALLTILLPNCKAQSSQKIDWDKLLKAWNAYLEYPSSENADKVTVLLPDSELVPFTNDPKENSAFDSISQNLGMLEYQIYSGDRSAVNLAFHYYSIADGEFAEALDIMLGNLIRINPQLFLEELSKRLPFLERMGLGFSVGSFGGEYVDKFEAQNLEATLRIKALQKVDNPALSSIRDECIKALEERRKKSDK